MIVALGDRDPSFLTHREVDAALRLFPADSGARWVATDSPAAGRLDEATGVWLLPGTPYRDADAAFAAIRHCLDCGTPFLGTCGGFQHALVERLDGLLLPGGDDFAPPRAYPPEVRFEVVPPRQLAFDQALLAGALARQLPVLGICYGMQLLALAAGRQADL